SMNDYSMSRCVAHNEIHVSIDFLWACEPDNSTRRSLLALDRRSPSLFLGTDNNAWGDRPACGLGEHAHGEPRPEDTDPPKKRERRLVQARPGGAPAPHAQGNDHGGAGEGGEDRPIDHREAGGRRAEIARG